MSTEFRSNKSDVVELKKGMYKIEELVRVPSPHPFDSPVTVTVYLLSWSLWASYLMLRYQSLSTIGLASADLVWIQWLFLLADLLDLLQ